MRPWPALVLALLGAAVPLVQQRIDARQDRWRAQAESLYVGDGRALRRLLPGFEVLAADLYWLRAVQYYGGKLAFEVGQPMPLLAPLLEITTTLDPRLEIAYRYGAIFLCEPPPRGAGDCPAGLRLLEKGVATEHLRHAWGMYQDLGYFRFLYMKDAAGASRDLMRGASEPGAPPTLASLAGSLLEKGGEARAARRIWKDLYEQYPEGYLRDNARFNLRRLEALDAIEQLNEVGQRLVAAGQSRPKRAEDLARWGVPPGLLRDSTGVPFEWDEARDSYYFGRSSEFWRPR